ncbi:MAG TPA: ImmA/IrrE family metallo-endopeptidase [Candidatus Saccharimonadales bacterium]
MSKTTTIDLNALIRESQKDHRIDVVDLAQRLGIPVYAVDLPTNCSGDIKREADGTILIEVNSNHPVTRQRFTIAHEVAHYVKHPQILARKGQLDRSDVYKNMAEITIEQEADKEAAAILMPEYLVKDYFGSRQWTDKTRFDADMIGEIAEIFRVSRAMAITRLRELGFPIPYLSFA